MADAVISVVVEKIIHLFGEQAKYHVNLVRGAEEEIHSLAYELETVRNVLDDAERRGYKEKSVKAWLSRLEQTTHALEDVLDEWNYGIRKLEMQDDRSDDAAHQKKKVWSFFSKCFVWAKVRFRLGIARKIVDVKKKLDVVLKEKDDYGFVICRPITEPRPVPSTSFADLEKVCGRDFYRDKLVTMLTGTQEELGVRVVSIVGVGGLGKTTLAQLVYNNSRVVNYFELRIWVCVCVCVSDPFDLAAIAKGILEKVGGGSSSNTTQLDVLLTDVQESISGKRFLLVLDDVWNEDANDWEPLKASLRCGGKGSKVLVTTERVAIAMGTTENDIHHPQLLSPEDCWSLLSRISLSGRREEERHKFQDIGKKIASKCNGLPLAACVLGSLLQFKDSLEEWESVFESELWQLEEAEDHLFPHLLLSYNQLTPQLKRCFSYCALFPKDFLFDVDNLIENWIAQGYLGSDVGNIGDIEHKGQEYFKNLAMRSLFQDFERDEFDEKIVSCKMHDVVHDFAESLRRDRSSVTVEAGTKKSTCHRCSSSLVSCVKTYRSLISYNQTYICDCFTPLRVLSVEADSLQRIPLKMGHLIHLRWLDLSFNGFSSEDVKIICRLYNLQFLRLKKCQLEEVPSEIGNLTKLRLLDLSSNDSLEELPKEIGNLTQLKHLDLSYNQNLKELPEEIWYLTQLEYLDLSYNKSLEEVPKEIGNLAKLKHLKACYAESLEELPQEIGNLIRLKHLNLTGTSSLKELPESIYGLKNLEHIFIDDSTPKLFSEGVSEMTGLRTLSQFWGGRGWGKLGWLKNLNLLSGSLVLKIKLIDDSKDMIEDAREAHLSNKIHLSGLELEFDDEMDEGNDLVRMSVVDALEPHPNLESLSITGYKGSTLPAWITSPLLQLRSIKLSDCNRMQSLPPFGKLPCLQELEFCHVDELQLVGREFLGAGFPKLKTLSFEFCGKWKEWEDITEEEEDSPSTFMPCLTDLAIEHCDCLTALPERLLGKKASSLEYVQIGAHDRNASSLIKRYQDREGAKWYTNWHLHVRLRPW